MTKRESAMRWRLWTPAYPAGRGVLRVGETRVNGVLGRNAIIYPIRSTPARGKNGRAIHRTRYYVALADARVSVDVITSPIFDTLVDARYWAIWHGRVLQQLVNGADAAALERAGNGNARV